MRWKLQDLAHRIDSTRVRIENPDGVPVILFAKQEVSIERDGIEQLLNFVSLERTLRSIEVAQRQGRIDPYWGDEAGHLRAVVLTPDFHRGGGIPVGTVAQAEGFVVPQAVGNDVCCGMRLLATDLHRDELAGVLDKLDGPLRAVFFQGRREIPMSPRQREALLREGLWGLHATSADNTGTGIWNYYDPKAQAEDLARVHFQGVLPARGLFAFNDFVQGSGANDGRDAQIGSVGGGNHFVELQYVDEVIDGHAARGWGLTADTVTIMVHSGSVGLGHTVGGHFHDQARGLYPKELPQPDHGFCVLPTSGPHGHTAVAYLDAMRNAANFAFGNRLFLGLMVLRVLSEVLGRRIQSRLVYDAPHNLIWERPDGKTFIHRKGACPALGPEPAFDGPFRYTGHPVIIPGSMGAHSFVLAGEGNRESLESACHGAGRALSRSDSRRVDESSFVQSAERLRVVTPIDPHSYEVRSRRDVLAQYRDRLKEEAPYAYKSITPVVETVEEAGIARRVARLWPLITVKG